MHNSNAVAQFFPSKHRKWYFFVVHAELAIQQCDCFFSIKGQNSLAINQFNSVHSIDYYKMKAKSTVNKKSSKVLNSVQIILKIFNLINKDGVRICRLKIPNVILASIIALIPIYGSFVLIWFCVDEKFSLSTSSSSLALALLIVKSLFIHFSLVWRSKVIVVTIDYLQNIVTRSMATYKDRPL